MLVRDEVWLDLEVGTRSRRQFAQDDDAAHHGLPGNFTACACNCIRQGHRLSERLRAWVADIAEDVDLIPRVGRDFEDVAIPEFVVLRDVALAEECVEIDRNSLVDALVMEDGPMLVRESLDRVSGLVQKRSKGVALPKFESPRMSHSAANPGSLRSIVRKRYRNFGLPQAQVLLVGYGQFVFQFGCRPAGGMDEPDEWGTDIAVLTDGDFVIDLSLAVYLYPQDVVLPDQVSAWSGGLPESGHAQEQKKDGCKSSLHSCTFPS